MTMKLYLFFIAMDLLTFLVYPIMFIYGRLHQVSKARETIVLKNPLAVALNVSGE
jgi:hypothetical protein